MIIELYNHLWEYLDSIPEVHIKALDENTIAGYSNARKISINPKGNLKVKNEIILTKAIEPLQINDFSDANIRIIFTGVRITFIKLAGFIKYSRQEGINIHI